MNELVKRLSDGDHPVETARPEKTAKALKERIDRDYVHVMFKETGTEIGVQLNRGECDFTTGDFEAGTGTVHLSGGLTLNFDKVRCAADIQLDSLEGRGHLEAVDDEEYERLMGRTT